jgi:hypothetical protein
MPEENAVDYDETDEELLDGWPEEQPEAPDFLGSCPPWCAGQPHLENTSEHAWPNGGPTQETSSPARPPWLPARVPMSTSGGVTLTPCRQRSPETDKLRRETHKLMALAGVRKVRLYDARHACLSWMANNGVPDTVVSARAGHSDLSFTKRTYVHPEAKSLRAGAEKLGELLG